MSKQNRGTTHAQPTTCSNAFETQKKEPRHLPRLFFESLLLGSRSDCEALRAELLADVAELFHRSKLDLPDSFSGDV